MFICAHFGIDVLSLKCLHILYWQCQFVLCKLDTSKKSAQAKLHKSSLALNSNDVDCRWRCVDESNAILLVSSLCVPSVFLFLSLAQYVSSVAWNIRKFTPKLRLLSRDPLTFAYKSNYHQFVSNLSKKALFGAASPFFTIHLNFIS